MQTCEKKHKEQKSYLIIRFHSWKKVKYSNKLCSLNNLFSERDQVSESSSTGVESNSNDFFIVKKQHFSADANSVYTGINK